MSASSSTIRTTAFAIFWSASCPHIGGKEPDTQSTDMTTRGAATSFDWVCVSNSNCSPPLSKSRRGSRFWTLTYRTISTGSFCSRFDSPLFPLCCLACSNRPLKSLIFARGGSNYAVMWLQRGRCYVVCGHIRIPWEFVRRGKSYYGKRRTESASRVTLDFALSERLSTCVPNPVSEIRATFPRVSRESKNQLST